MSLMEKIKIALKKGIEPKQVAYIYGVSPYTVEKLYELMKERGEI